MQTFPAYDKLDGVYYLIGYCHNEMGQSDIARMAWLNLVCANHFTYTGRSAAQGRARRRTRRARARSIRRSASTPSKPPAAARQRSVEDPYADCEPAVKDSKFYAETWLRIGEYHFDFDITPHGLARAISAYSKVLQRPDDRNYNLALYKLAWTYYRASRYPEAMENFWKAIHSSSSCRLTSFG